MERRREVPILSEREGGGRGRRFTGATPASEKRQCRCLAARYNRLLSTQRARERSRRAGSFFGSGSSGYFKGHRPEHTLFLWFPLPLVRRMFCTYHRPVGTWIGVKSKAALIYNANVHSRGKTKMKWMAGNECTLGAGQASSFFPVGKVLEITPPKQSDGRTDGASRVHYITCVNCATGA